MKLPNLNLNRWFVPESPKLATSSGGDDRFGSILLSSRSGGGSGGDDYGFPDDDDFQDAPAEPPRSPRTGGGGGRGGGSGGRQRTIQFQPEDRYWTEYLRIALPIIGLILMLGLFWYWATNIIGDDPTTDPEPTASVGAVSTLDVQPTATEEEAESTIATTPEETEPSEDPTATDEPEETPEDEEPTEEPDEGDGEFSEGDMVMVTEDGVNFRTEATTEGEIIRELDAGEVLEVIGTPEEADDYTWYNVVDSEGENGWVVDDFLEAAE